MIPKPCPGGYRLEQQRDVAGSGLGANMSCECFERSEVIACEEDQDNVLVRVSFCVFLNYYLWKFQVS